MYKNSNIRKVIKIHGPDGSSGSWITDSNFGMLETAINVLNKLMVSDDHGFSISITECDRIVPETIKLYDDDIAYIRLEWCIKKQSNNTITKSENLISRIIRECTINDAYLGFLESYANTRDDPAVHTIFNEIKQITNLIKIPISVKD